MAKKQKRNFGETMANAILDTGQSFRMSNRDTCMETFMLLGEIIAAFEGRCMVEHLVEHIFEEQKTPRAKHTRKAKGKRK